MNLIYILLALALVLAGLWFARKRAMKRIKATLNNGANTNQAAVLDEGEEEHREYKFSYWAVIGAAHVLTYVPELFLEPLVTIGPVTISYWHLVLFLQIVYDYLSLTVVAHTNTVKEGGVPVETRVIGQGPNEIGALFVFGRYICGTGPGLVYAAYGIVSHSKESVLIQQVEIPTDLVDRYTDPETGKPLTSLRMTTSPATTVDGSGVDGEKTSMDPLATGRLTLEVSIVVSYRLSRTPRGYRKFIERIGTIGDFLQIVDDEVVTALRQEIAQVTPSQVFELWQDIQLRVEAKLRTRVGEVGFDELRVIVKAFDLPKRVNEGLADRTKAQIGVGTELLIGEQAKVRDTRVAEANRALAAATLQGILDAFKQANPGVELTAEQLLVLAHQNMLGIVLPTAEHTAYGLGPGGLIDPNLANVLVGANRPGGPLKGE